MLQVFSTPLRSLDENPDGTDEEEATTHEAGGEVRRSLRTSALTCQLESHALAAPRLGAPRLGVNFALAAQFRCGWLPRCCSPAPWCCCSAL